MSKCISLSGVDLLKTSLKTIVSSTRWRPCNTVHGEDVTLLLFISCIVTIVLSPLTTFLQLLISTTMTHLTDYFFHPRPGSKFVYSNSIIWTYFRCAVEMFFVCSCWKAFCIFHSFKPTNRQWQDFKTGRQLVAFDQIIGFIYFSGQINNCIYIVKAKIVAVTNSQRN